MAKNKDFPISKFKTKVVAAEAVVTTSYRMKPRNKNFIKMQTVELGYRTESAYLNALIEHLKKAS